jgi:hypothetical protein
VPFTVLAPKSCVVLNSRYRKDSGLPKSVWIPVDRKADVLYFLHTGTWLLAGPPSGAHYWVYLVNYADGPSERVVIFPGVNVRDCGAVGPWKFEDTAGMRTTMPSEPKGGVPTPVGGVSCVEWLNPRRDTPIKGIEMWTCGGWDSVPILLAVTGAVRQ